MLTAIVLLPTAISALLLCVPRSVPRVLFLSAWAVTAAAELVLTMIVLAGYRADGGMQYETRARWIPSAGISYHVGVDGLSLPLVAVCCVLFLACALYAWRETKRVREFAALFLFLQTTCLGLFVALDLILFFVFFDLSIAAMYFIIAGWGHQGAARAALKFFLYTFIGLYLAADPHTFDIVDLTRAKPLAGRSTYGALWYSSPSPSDWRSRRRPCPSTPGCRPPTPTPRPPGRRSSPACC